MLGVVIPAHDEEQYIGACLESVRRAMRCPRLHGEPVAVVVVLDSCTDQTGSIARRWGARTATVAARNVGVARAHGAQVALEAGARWLAFTDADTRVGPEWLSAQLAQRSDAVCGTIEVCDWDDYGAALRQHHADHYQDADGHRHIHGANLGVTADAYERAGGFQPLCSSEDVALVEALRGRGASIAWSAAPRVITSARRHYRAPGGFGETLERMQHALVGWQPADADRGMTMAADPAFIDRLRKGLSDLDPARAAAEHLDRLIAAGLDILPLPGAGATAVRWAALAEVAAFDLSLAKLYEGHTDALAILAEVGAHTATPTGSWGVWAAEAPQGRTVIDIEGVAGAEVRLSGAKCWCSGAATADHALLTAWLADGRGPFLVQVDLRQPGVTVHADAWKAVGMAGSASLDVSFDGARGRRVGAQGAYLARPGFWHGGAGIAACWHGGAVSLARTLRAALARGDSSSSDAFRLAALGRVDVALRATVASMREAALWLDSHPHADAAALALRVRLQSEAAATHVLSEVGRALGAGPFCRDARYARMAADLPVFIRQSHAERDLATLGAKVADGKDDGWQW